MKKKRKSITDEQPLIKREIPVEDMTAAMRRLKGNPDFVLLQRSWMTDRIMILERGKAKPEAAIWDELRGFDRAIMKPEFYANKKTSEDVNEERRKRLMADLNGGK